MTDMIASEGVSAADLKKKVQRLRKDEKLASEEGIALLWKLGLMQYATKQYNSSVSAFEEHIKLKRMLGQVSFESLFEPLVTLGQALSYCADQSVKCLSLCEEAIALAEQEKEKLRQRQQQRPSIFGVLYHIYGTQLVKTKSFEAGIRILTTYCVCCSANLKEGQDQEEKMKEMADVFYYLGYALLVTKKFNGAISNLEKSCAIQQALLLSCEYATRYYLAKAYAASLPKNVGAVVKNLVLCLKLIEKPTNPLVTVGESLYQKALDMLGVTLYNTDCDKYPRAVCFFSKRFWEQDPVTEEKCQADCAMTLELLKRAQMHNGVVNSMVTFEYGRVMYLCARDPFEQDQAAKVIRLAGFQGYRKAIDFLAEEEKSNAESHAKWMPELEEFMKNCMNMETKIADQHRNDILKELSAPLSTKNSIKKKQKSSKKKNVSKKKYVKSKTVAKIAHDNEPKDQKDQEKQEAILEEVKVAVAKDEVAGAVDVHAAAEEVAVAVAANEVNSAESLEIDDEGDEEDDDDIAMKEERSSDGSERIEELIVFHSKVLGCGATSSVFEGNLKGRPVAVKMMLMFTTEAQQAAKAEIKALQIGDTHQNVVSFYAQFQKGARMFLVMELCVMDLGSLFSSQSGGGGGVGGIGVGVGQEAAKRMKIMQGLSKTDMVRQLCEGMKFLHGAGIVHRDIKPGNILVHSSNVVKISDFGFAKVTELEKSKFSARLQTGSDGWRAPEVVAGKLSKHPSSSDVFSVGLVAFFVFSSGKHPFGWPSHQQEEKEKNSKKSSLAKRTRLPDAVQDDFVAWMLEYEENERISMAKALLHPVFLGLEDRLTYLTRMYHDNKGLLQKVDMTDWHKVVEEDLWNAFTFTYSPNLRGLLKCVRTLEQHCMDDLKIRTALERILKCNHHPTRSNVMEYVQTKWPTLLDECFALQMKCRLF